MHQDDQHLLLHEEGESLSERYFGLSTQKFLVAASIVLSVGVYMGFIFFGDNSLSVLLELEEHQDYLSEDIERLKAENASLQKQYFELKELDADSQ
ncbi:MAG: hypothetical protein A2023_04055 [Sulfuricurvum sp. GWF2_44_89]|jgi:hypothetical protein|uniref:Septum formation initiator n=2 Tax=Pseudomonadati TaxID=3379134 RepID=A0A2D3WRV0_9BACT|nr:MULTISPECIES: hypothetical protein [Sulfuricurvum]OHD77628.1 MAG: hypothetical protein A2023_04055 [Sulfuricurvum sp. GWF2_44_89]OHD92897.1 MAG: hypothetical protein A2552_02420 [Sulfuricurvum sp. RIFOXYD2_FULL_44_160]OHD96155.1 MAG: hypothetical protein A2517_05235 [Sulfuricurvum sp. RIFOXYD12_FULL_44_77]DAB39463.1 MAG TPA: hypothetical protein CFH83_00705 [Sulfuricurvum kujiense]